MTDSDENQARTLYDEPRELTPEERASLYKLIGIANDHLIYRKTSRQTAIDALSIASVLIQSNKQGVEPGDHSFGIAPGNVPEDALPPSYDIEAEEV